MQTLRYCCWPTLYDESPPSVRPTVLQPCVASLAESNVPNWPVFPVIASHKSSSNTVFLPSPPTVQFNILCPGSGPGLMLITVSNTRSCSCCLLSWHELNLFHSLLFCYNQFGRLTAVKA